MVSHSTSSSVLWLHLSSWVRSLFNFLFWFWRWCFVWHGIDFNKVIGVIIMVQCWELHILVVWYHVGIEFTKVKRWVLKLFILLLLLELDKSSLVLVGSVYSSFSGGLFLSFLLLFLHVDLDVLEVFHFLGLPLN